MDLPTYTNIWRIEKRLYKLYDFRLPAPLPINWIAVFTGITVPYVVLLVAIGVPFDHSLVWLYVLPPGLLTWLTTRPVIESKRLPELLESQIRYLAEPRVWCRLAPLGEKDQIVVTARVWHSRRVPRQRRKEGSVALRARGTLARRHSGAADGAAAPAAVVVAASAAVAVTAAVTAAASPSAHGSSRLRARAGAKAAGSAGAPVRARSAEPRAAATAATVQARPAPEPGLFRLAGLRSRQTGSAPALPPGVALQPPAGAGSARQAGRAQPSLGRVAAPAPTGMPAHATPDVHPVSPVGERAGAPAAPRIEVSHGDHAAEQPPPQQTHTPPPMVKAVAESEQHAVPSIERALSGPSKDRALSWHGKVRIVTGATQGPGARDQEALDRARARLPLSGPKRVLMLGCTSGAGQTVTTLLTGHILASLREQPVAAVDLHDGTLTRHGVPAGWLEEILAGKAPQRHETSRPDGLHPVRAGTPAQLDVIASREALRDGDERLLADYLGRHYPLTMLDPGAAGLTKLLKITDQLVVVVPASAEAAVALADTRDWLDAHGFADLAAHSVTLVNGVSRRSLADVMQAESVARGRCRAIVRVPWDDMVLTGPSALRSQTRVAYTALAGVLVAGMAAAPIRTQQ